MESIPIQSSDKEVICNKCGTANSYYNDNTPPFRCSKCGTILVNLYPDPPIRGDPAEWM